MGLQIRIDQSGASAGTPGQAREDLATGLAVQLTAVGGPFVQYQWTILWKPVDVVANTRSAAALTSPSTSVTNLQPIDKAGTYFVEVAVDSGSGLGALASDVARITFYAGPTLNATATSLPRRVPAVGETDEHNVPDSIDGTGNPDGWGRELARWFALIAQLTTSAVTFGTDLQAIDASHQKVVGLVGTAFAFSTPGSAGNFIGYGGGLDWALLTFGGDISYTNTTSQKVVGLQGRAVDTTAPFDGQPLTWVSSASKWRPVTANGDVSGPLTALVLGSSGVTAGSYGSASAVPVITVDAKGRITGATTAALPFPSRPANDQFGAIEYRFNETAQIGVLTSVLVNHGSYGTGVSGSIGPAPTTLTAGFPQPAVGSTVVASVASTTGYQAGQLILVAARPGNGGGANYYYLTSVGAGTLTLKNLGITGGTYISPTVTVGGNGTSVSAVLDLLVLPSQSPASVIPLQEGKFDYCMSFTGQNNASWSNYGMGSGGFPDGAGLTAMTLHVLLRPKAFTTSAKVFGYSHSQGWGTGGLYTDIDLTIQSSSSGATTWAVSWAGQSFSGGTITVTNVNGYLALYDTALLTFTWNVSTGAMLLYKNGVLVGSGTTGTGTFSFGSGGYFFVAQPNPTGGDTGDGCNADLMWIRLHANEVLTAGQVAAVYDAINPPAAGWPLP